MNWGRAFWDRYLWFVVEPQPASILPPVGLNPQEIERASSSMGEAVQLAISAPSLSEALLSAAAKKLLPGRTAWP